MQPDNNLDPFGLRRTAEAARRGPSHIKFLFLFVGAGIVMSFLVLASLAPQIGDRLGNLAVRKQTQESRAANAKGPCYPYGEANADGNVDNVDALRIIRHVSGIQPLPSTPPVSFDTADVDNDNQVTSRDALVIQRYVAGFISNFDACPKPSPHEIYSLKLLPSESIAIDTTVASGIQALLHFNGQVVTNQSDFKYSWAISSPGTNIKITPFAVCTFGIQKPCPMDHANISGSAPSGTSAKIVVNVSRISTNSTVTQGTFILTVK